METEREPGGLAAGSPFLGGAAGPRSAPVTLEVLGTTVGLPDAGADDLSRVDRAERLATPEAWREWLCEHTGREVWLDGPPGLRKQPENNFMARAEVGDVVGRYVKTAEVREGMAVWALR